ncbi:hypothetical protein ACIF70_41720 [Actinacidiphila glaucinigra]|uniref:hypothetical protein n=1 Tax=Actinacidiphila glaucinigra TaxID=235986 RepID=UPI0037C9ACE5
MKRDATPEDAEHGAPPPKDQQDPRQARGRDLGGAQRKRPEADVPDSPRGLPPQEPPD